MKFYADWINGIAIGLGIVRHFEKMRWFAYINLFIVEFGIYIAEEKEG